MAIERTVSFWHCYVSGSHRAETWPSADYLDAIRTFGTLSGEERTINGVCHVVHPGENGLCLSMHKPIDRDFLAKVDWSAGALVEQDDEDSSAVFANSTVVYFYPKYGAFALSRVNNSSPRQGAVRDLLDRCLPPGQGEHWVVTPMMDTTALDLFKNHATGVLSVSTSFSTLKQLGQEPQGIATYGDNLAQNIDAELDLEVVISLNARRAHAQGPMARLRDAVIVDLPRILSSRDNGTQVTAMLDTGETRVLDLVEQALAVKESIEDTVASNNARLFNELLAVVIRVSGEWQDRVYKMLEG